MKVNDLGDRLRRAREDAGYASASEAARRIGVNVVTYTAHENGGREFDRKAALHYATQFGVDPAWLLFGGEMSPPRESLKNSGIVKNSGQTLVVSARSTRTKLKEKDLEDVWEMPDDFMSRRLKISRDRARILEVMGDSMYDPDNPHAPGSLYPGERVIVDIDDARPTPPGPFVIHDGAGVVIKLVEVIPQSDPQMIRLTGRNPRYGTHELPYHEVNIVGRVKGKISLI